MVEPNPINYTFSPFLALLSQARPVTALPSVVAELPWSTWEETDLEDCLLYLMGSDRLKIPAEWAAHVPTPDHLKAYGGESG